MSCNGVSIPFVQTTFLGASIVQFSSQIDWSGSGGGLQVELVEDTCNGDSFNPPQIGSPVWFSMGGFTYGGILQNWKEDDSASGPKTYSVNLSGPYELMEGCQVILSNYTGSTLGISNLLNAHGWIEANYGSICRELGYTGRTPGYGSNLSYRPAPGFTGNSYSNEMGISWNTLRHALMMILNGLGGSYGKQISFRGHSYIVDVSELPYVSGDMYIGGESMSLADIISQVCKLSGIEYFYELIIVEGVNIIKIRTTIGSIITSDISAKIVDNAVGASIQERLSLGSISSAITNTVGVGSYSRGLELATSTTNVFMTGEFRHEIWQMPYYGDQEGYNDTIWPYWGKNNDGTIIVGTGSNDGNIPSEKNDMSNTHRFTIDISELGLNQKNTWEINNFELQAAMQGEQQWRAWLEGMEPTKLYGIYGVSERSIPDSGHIKDRMNAAGGVEILSAISADNGGMKGMDTQSWENAKAIAIATIDQTIEDKVKKLYNIVKTYAEEYFGKKFMVKLWGICWRTKDQLNYQYSWEQADSAWTEWSVLGLTSNHWILERFREDDGKIKCFVKYMSDTPLIMDGLNQEDYVLVNNYTAFVAATAEEIVWVSPTDPRMVISIGSPVLKKNIYNVLPDYLLGFALTSGSHGFNSISFQSMLKGFSNDKLNLSMSEMPIMPIAAAVPMKSKRLVYGPWLATDGTNFNFYGGDDYFVGGDNGKTEYQRDTGFAPWNFGSFDIMNRSAYTTVNSSYNNSYVAEMGSVEVAGAPVGSLGSLISSGGPVISSIDVRIGRGNGPVTTSYRMRTHTRDTGQLAKTRIDQIKDANLKAINTQRMFRKYTLDKYTKITSDYVTKFKENDHTIGRMGHTSHVVMGAQSFRDHNGPSLATTTKTDTRKFADNTQRTITTYSPARYQEATQSSEPHAATSVTTSEGCEDIYNIRGDIPHAYRKRAYMEQCGMFRPFSTLPHNQKASKDDAYFISHWSNDINTDKVLDNGDSVDGSIKISESSDLTSHFDFFQHEQLPPVVGESHLPINITTLSPFLSSGKALSISSSAGWGLGVNIASGGSKGHDIEYIARDGVYPTHMSVRHPSDNYSTEHWYRAIALRGPLVLAGWGFDIDNKPVPNASTNYPEEPSIYFEQDFLRKPQKWVCGPVDLRWDYKRNVWTAPSPMKPVRIKMVEDVLVDSSGFGIIFNDQVQYDANGNEISLFTDEEYESGYRVSVRCDRVVSKNDFVIAYFDTTKNEYVLLSNGSNFHTGVLLDDVRPGDSARVYVYSTNRTITAYVYFFEYGWGETDETGRVIKNGTQVGITKNSDNGDWNITLVAETITEESSSLSSDSSISSLSSGSSGSETSTSSQSGETIDVVTDVSFDAYTCELIVEKTTIRVLEIL